MTRYAAFLRGVNVGGVNLKMAEVAAALENAGFGGIKTILATGRAAPHWRVNLRQVLREKADA